jgi:hypothetical protein
MAGIDDIGNGSTGSYDYADSESSGGGPTAVLQAMAERSKKSATGGGNIHSYPLNLDSSAEGTVQECIRFTAVKQGGISLEGDNYEKASAETQRQQDVQFVKGERKAWLEGLGNEPSKQQQEEFDARQKFFETDGRTSDIQALREEKSMMSRAGSGFIGFLKTQSKLASATPKDLEHCFLYMPPAISYSEGASWGTEELGAMGNLVKDAISGKTPIDQMVKDFSGGAVAGLAKLAATAAGAGMGGLMGGVGGYILGTEMGKGLRAAGRFATNPYEEQMFNGIPFRNFSFEFVFTPNSEKEGLEVLKIIKMFRFHSRPGYVGGIAGDGLFTFPNEFRINFATMQNGRWVDNKALPKIHNCVCTSVGTNYTPEGFWVAMRDGRPMSITLTLAFNETKKIVQTVSDPEKGGGVEEGY